MRGTSYFSNCDTKRHGKPARKAFRPVNSFLHRTLSSEDSPVPSCELYLFVGESSRIGSHSGVTIPVFLTRNAYSTCYTLQHVYFYVASQNYSYLLLAGKHKPTGITGSHSIRAASKTRSLLLFDTSSKLSAHIVWWVFCLKSFHGGLTDPWHPIGQVASRFDFAGPPLTPSPRRT